MGNGHKEVDVHPPYSHIPNKNHQQVPVSLNISKTNESTYLYYTQSVALKYILSSIASCVKFMLLSLKNVH